MGQGQRVANSTLKPTIAPTYIVPQLPSKAPVVQTTSKCAWINYNHNYHHYIDTTTYAIYSHHFPLVGHRLKVESKPTGMIIIMLPTNFTKTVKWAHHWATIARRTMIHPIQGELIPSNQKPPPSVVRLNNIHNPICIIASHHPRLRNPQHLFHQILCEYQPAKPTR